MNCKSIFGIFKEGFINKSALSVLFLICLILISVPPAYSENIIIGSGCSVSNVGYLTDLVKEYEKRSGKKVFVRGGGSIAGLEDLKSGKVDFAASCRIRNAEDPKDIEFIQVAWDALVFIVHKSNPLKSISPDEIRAIYDGRIVNWKELKGGEMPIKLFISIARKGLSGVDNSVKEMILNGKDEGKIPNSISLASTGIVEQMIEHTPEGLASGFSSSRKRNVKMLKVDGIYPNKKNIASDKYPFRRPLFILIPKKPKLEVKQFVDFVLSKEGQKLISSYGIVALPDIHPAKKRGASNGAG